MVAAAVEVCTIDHVIQALNRRKSAGPTSLPQIRRALPKHLRKCDQALAEAIDQGRVWEYGITAKSKQYWTQSPADFAWSKVEMELKKSSGGVTEKKLLTKVSSPLLKGLVEPRELIDSFVRQQRMFVQPRAKAGQRTLKYTLEPLQFVDQLVSELIAKISKVADLNDLNLAGAMERARSIFLNQPVAHHAVSAPPEGEDKPFFNADIFRRPDQTSRSDSEIGELILQAMREVNPRVVDGDLVLISELRQRLDFHMIEKSQFDRVMMNLYMARRVVLSKTSASLISENERFQFVTDREGHFYNTVALWRD
jgi:hypothetical protein